MASKATVHNSLTVPSAISAVRNVCEQLLSGVRANMFSEEDVFAIHLAFEEAFTNAVKHGNKTDATKRINIEYDIFPDRVDISIADQGNGFDPAAVPDPRNKENICKSSGRGRLLIRS